MEVEPAFGMWMKVKRPNAQPDQGQEKAHSPCAAGVAAFRAALCSFL